MNGNGKLRETENVIFYVSYGILTEFLRINVILHIFETEHGDTDTDERLRNNPAGNQVQVSVTNRSREFYTDISAAVFPFLDHPALNALRCKGFLKIK